MIFWIGVIEALTKQITGAGLPYESHIAMCPPNRLGFWAFLTWNAHIGLKSGLVLEGTTGAYERNYRFSSKWISMKFEVHLKTFFAYALM